MLKLSEAIRLGAMLRPQGVILPLTAFGNTCAIGAALDAVGALPKRWWLIPISIKALRYWPELGMDVVQPVTGRSMRLRRAIFQLNDVHRWTRERIADWVATVERVAQDDAAVGVHAER